MFITLVYHPLIQMFILQTLFSCTRYDVILTFYFFLEMYPVKKIQFYKTDFYKTTEMYLYTEKK